MASVTTNGNGEVMRRGAGVAYSQAGQLGGAVGSPHALDHEASRGEGFLVLEGRRVYRVAGVGGLEPFLMTLSSESDLWMFVSSTGGLTAGRRDAAGALFPYETEDRLHRLHGVSGPVTVIRRVGEVGVGAWEPMAAFGDGGARTLYRDVDGSAVTFEERDAARGLRLRQRWTATEALGFVRTVWLTNESGAEVELEVLDGVLNVLPAGVAVAMQQSFSCLLDAYKRAEVEAGGRLAVYSLTSQVGDKPEAGEVLRATGVWSEGLPGARVVLDERAVGMVRRGETPEGREVVVGRRGAYLLWSRVRLGAGETVRWRLVADVEQCHRKLSATRAMLRGGGEAAAIDRAEAATVAGLRRVIDSADGAQASNDPVAVARHRLNTLMNVMRGGMPIDGYAVDAADFVAFVAARNRGAAARAEAMVSPMGWKTTTEELIEAAGRAGDADLWRLAMEYLPLTFSRRHGDPSRPWNAFTIRVKTEDGAPVAAYQGNWRDIFQNWEALGLSYPRLLKQFVAKFLSASTVDGFNPYRVTSEGIDWEVPSPDEPWAHLGYWGDHQIVYLSRLLELLHAHEPAWIAGNLGRRGFAFADVPYELKTHEEICADPKHSIRFDRVREAEVGKRVREVGADGKLVRGADGRVRHASLLEKLLIPLMTKVCAVVPGGGVWLNTQRPEWNDANNALAGWGLSVVTLGHLKRYVAFLRGRLAESVGREAEVAAEVAGWARDVARAISDEREGPALFHRLGRAFEAYRSAVYARGFSGDMATVGLAEVETWLARAEELVTAALDANRRKDGLYHSYNLLSLEGGERPVVSGLELMLEGQVSALSSGAVSPAAGLSMLGRLFESPLYRRDLGTFMLYPERELAGFWERNRVPGRFVGEGSALRALMEAGDASVVREDGDGLVRFHPEVTSEKALRERLGRVSRLVGGRESEVLEAFEATFGHSRFTGRSASMYAYEGLGCVYWHMVGKLLVAAQELYWLAAEGEGPGCGTARGLAGVYYRLRDGLGLGRTAAEHGAVPFEPYSHSAAKAGARQPGMTGQVKEELITRRGELGVRVSGGRVWLRPWLLRRRELMPDGGALRVTEGNDVEHDVKVPAGGMGFTLCGTPVVYRFARDVAGATVTVHGVGGVERSVGESLDAATSRAVFSREGTVLRLEAVFPESMLTLE